MKSDELRVDQCGWSILDTAISLNGDLIAYGTWKDAVFVGKLDFTERQNITWFPIDLNGEPGRE